MLDARGYLRERGRQLGELAEGAWLAAAPGALELLAGALEGGGKVLAFGNGGSAAQAQHFAAELVGRFERERRALPALSLSTDGSALTALGNDYAFEEIFARQVQALARPGDALLALSTSGRSENVRRACLAGRKQGARTVGLLGGEGGTIRDAVEVALIVPARDTALIQEVHGLLLHALCRALEGRLGGN
ncbi:MAG: SIS domain-containing protein [Nitrospinota bacterium]